MTYHQVCNNMTGATSGAGTAYPSGAPEFTPALYFVCPFILFLLVFLVLSVLRFCGWAKKKIGRENQGKMEKSLFYGKFGGCSK